MGKRIALGLAASLTAILLILVGVAGGLLLGAVPIGFLLQAKTFGPALDPLLPLCGIAGAFLGCWAAVRAFGHLGGWLHRRRLPGARRDRIAIEATIVGHRATTVSYRGTTTWTYRLEFQWTDPVTSGRRGLTRRYVFRRKRQADVFRDAYCATHRRVPVLVKSPGRPDSAVVDIPYAPVWTEMW